MSARKLIDDYLTSLGVPEWRPAFPSVGLALVDIHFISSRFIKVDFVVDFVFEGPGIDSDKVGSSKLGYLVGYTKTPYYQIMKIDVSREQENAAGEFVEEFEPAKHIAMYVDEALEIAIAGRILLEDYVRSMYGKV